MALCKFDAANQSNTPMMANMNALMLPVRTHNNCCYKLMNFVAALLAETS